ncbi:hypothetical protein [Lipingzhangella rawalii]|uniref:hypothetical protein n=1 Tax=Lipingzhangella rawalii TaxID=2055835 RepID=UPI003898EEA9
MGPQLAVEAGAEFVLAEPLLELDAEEDEPVSVDPAEDVELSDPVPAVSVEAPSELPFVPLELAALSEPLRWVVEPEEPPEPDRLSFR